VCRVDEYTSGFQAYQKAVRNNRGDLRVALAESSKELTPQSGPRVIQHTTRSNKVIDTEKTLEKKELKADGLIVTEKKQTVEHEEVSLRAPQKSTRTFSAFLARVILVCNPHVARVCERYRCDYLFLTAHPYEK